MQHTPLMGYLLHARPYREKQAIYQLFSQEWGVVHGVGSRGVPSFAQIELFATGKNSLKNFSQIHIKSALPSSHLGQNQYALLYLNELIYKLIAPENPCPMLWWAYHESLSALQKNPIMPAMKEILRQFEVALFDELGVGIEWAVDSMGRAMMTHDFYEFVPTQGFVKSKEGILGESLLMIAKNDTFDGKLAIIGQVHRHLIDYLLDYQPLNSRKLWIEQLKYADVKEKS